ncbi:MULTISPECIES: zinc ribbon domain-containing protein [unclassified Acidovorax]|uniref:zinc ribbon domain-containing protein n=1 Tax=unclassified Acidovorax TaxID=2684926 RepID=UPI0006F32ADE|nr:MULTISPECIES: zinc ribbon domain-containing protein [unclassified Acidovorax]KRB30382.1 hypothetical protein ASD94_04135 [Acidovorax sp. Root70]PUA98316.1 hypothetical protein C8C99_3184 [Acidovorax sp. 107]
MNHPQRFLPSDDHPYSIFRLPEALTCWQAVAVMGASYLAAALLAALGSMVGHVSIVFPVLLGLLALVLVIAGTSGAGVCLTDLARGRPYRGVLSYCVAGLFSLPKLLGAGLLMLLLYGAVLLGVALVLLVCKLPGIGPVLLVVAVPLLVLTVALALLGYYVAVSIVGPAIWDGERVMHALSITWGITRNHPFAAIGKIIGGLLLSGIFAALVFGLVGVSSAIVGGMAAPIIGTGMGLDWDALVGGYGSSHWVGAGIGYVLVFVTASAFVFLLPLMVGVLTWCEFSDKVDRSTIRSSTDSALNDVNARVAELKDKAQTPVAPAAAPVVAAAAAGATSAAVAAHPGNRCPQCAGVVHADDRFCEHCGHKLQ